MKYEIVKLDSCSGYGASIYSVILYGEDKTLLEKFIEENISEFKGETEDILKRLSLIGKLGARSGWFKENEGSPGDLVCALFDEPERHLRVYCIKYGMDLIVVGGGGPKPEGMRSLQESEKLTSENKIMKEVSGDIHRLMREGELRFSDDYKDLIGHLKVNYEDE